MENNEKDFDMNEGQNEATPEQAPATVETPAAEVNEGKGFSIAALVLGILGIVGSWIPVVSYFTLICAILGIIFGIKGKKMSAAANGKPSGMATAGFVLGIIGVAFAIIGVICAIGCVACLCARAGALSELEGLY